MKMTWSLVLGIAALAIPTVAASQNQVQIGGVASFVARNTNERDLTNLTFSGDSNLRTMQLRMFLDTEVSGGVQFFAQTLSSNFSFMLYSAYARFEGIGDTNINAQMGVIPNTVGSFGPRTYSDRNPLVGTPLMWLHHTSLNPKDPAQTDIDALLAARDTRNQAGLPIVYDFCWNTGIEVYGERGDFDYSVALLSGSVTRPTRVQDKQLPQATARLVWHHSAATRVGVSGFLGPYLSRDLAGITFVNGDNENDYLNGGVGGDFYTSWRFLEFHSEAFHAWWQHPYFETLQATSGYLEGKYKFRPGWHFAGRGEFFVPSEVQDSSGATRRWDYSVTRVEYGFGYRPAPRVTTKLVAQHNRFHGSDVLDRDHYMVQLSAGF